MIMRTSKPAKGNKFYTRKASGGYSTCIKGKPTDACDVLANCVGYACGRFNEIIGSMKYPSLNCNAENFIERAKSLGLKVVSYPTLGGIMVWRKGATLSGNDGAGHVAVVERIDSNNQIYTSESGYGGTAFFNSLRKNTNGRWGASSAYTFRGCIVNPAIGDVQPFYKVGVTYTTAVILKVRKGAGTNYGQVAYSALTSNAKANAYSAGVNKGCLKKGTRVTCLEIKQVNGNTWLRIPSGWVAGIYNNNKYVQ